MSYVIYTDGLTMRCSNEEVSHTIRHKMHRRISRTGAPQNSSAHALRLERPNAMMANLFFLFFSYSPPIKIGSSMP